MGDMILLHNNNNNNNEGAKNCYLSRNGYKSKSGFLSSFSSTSTHYYYCFSIFSGHYDNVKVFCLLVGHNDHYCNVQVGKRILCVCERERDRKKNVIFSYTLREYEQVGLCVRDK